MATAQRDFKFTYEEFRTAPPDMSWALAPARDMAGSSARELIEFGLLISPRWFRGRTRGSMAMRVARPTRAAMFTSLSIVNLLIRPFTSSLTRDHRTPNRLAASA